MAISGSTFSQTFLMVMHTNLLTRGVDGQPIEFLFDTKTYDFEGCPLPAFWEITMYLSFGGNFRQNTFDLSLAPRGDNRTETGFYIQDEIFYREIPFCSWRTRRLLRCNLDGVVFSPRLTFMYKPMPEHTLARIIQPRISDAPSLVNNFLDVTIITCYS